MPSSLQQLLLSQCDCTSHRMQAQVRIYEQQQSISTVQQHVQILLQEFGTLESSAHIVESKSTAQQEVIEKQRQTLQKQQLHISNLSMQYSNLEAQRRGPLAAPLATTHDTSAQENGDAPPRGDRKVEEWECSHCTVMNQASKLVCSICRKKRKVPSVQSAPLQQEADSQPNNPVAMQSSLAGSMDSPPPDGDEPMLLRALRSIGKFNLFKRLIDIHPDIAPTDDGYVEGYICWPAIGENIQVLKTLKCVDNKTNKPKTKQVVQPNQWPLVSSGHSLLCGCRPWWMQRLWAWMSTIASTRYTIPAARWLMSHSKAPTNKATPCCGLRRQPHVFDLRPS